MSDPIKDAINTVQAKNSDGRKLFDLATNKISNNNVEKLKKLPITKDPVLIKKEKEAEVLKKKTEAEELKLNAKQILINEGKTKLKDFIVASIPFPPKLPFIDPKIIQAVDIAKQLKKLAGEKKETSKNNLEKGKETYTYPLTPVKKTEPTPEPPKIPEASPPPPTISTKMKYFIEINSKSNKGLWAVLIYDNTDGNRDFLDSKYYSKSKYSTENEVKTEVTNLIKSNGLIGFPPQPDFTF
jgi:hypothetical protein